MSESELIRDCEKQLKKNIRKGRRDVKLQELEMQLEFAESRCGTLKQQLDYIKMLYQRTRDPNLEKQFSKNTGTTVKQFSSNELFNWKNQIQEQNESVINGEDGDGPALIKQTSHSNTMTTISSTKYNRKDMNDFKRKIPKTGLKMLKTKKKSGRKVKKRRRLDSSAGSSKISNASSQTQTPICKDAVVEIYKNSVVNAESESGLELIGRSKFLRANESFRQHINNKINNENPKNVDEIKAKSLNSLNPPKTETNFEGEIQQIFSSLNKQSNQEKQNDLEEYSNEGNKPKTENFYFETVKNYSKPTISSKRKQIARDIYSNLNNLNIRHLPFVAARSTAPSHNIGVNIQQVLSIIKKRHPISENLLNITESGSQENPLATLTCRKIEAKTMGAASAPVTGISDSWDLKPQTERPRTSISHWKSNSEIVKSSARGNEKIEMVNDDWNLKVEKLKKVLVFLHEDFTSLSGKYKRLQKKLTKRNITKTDAKDELANIERSLERKEEEITIVIVLYKEVLNLRENFKKLQEKYNLITSGRSLLMDGFRHSNSTHTQMTNLLRKIQDLQTKLKG